MERMNYEERIRELEAQLELMKERYQILMETTSALLFEYFPREDRMIFIYNYPDNKSRKEEIAYYHKYVENTKLVHPDHVKRLLGALDQAAVRPMRDEIEYLSRKPEGEFLWHKACYSSVADSTGQVSMVVGRIHNIHSSVTEREKMIRKMELDFLTGLYNKGTATEKITRWLQDNPDSGAHMIMLDLDDFKAINDTYGHAFGDVVLKESARLMEKCFSPGSILSRFGGDEFIVFVTDEPLSEVEGRINTLMEMMKEEITGMDWPLHCSVGITARISPEDDFEALFNRADNVMYVAKQTGRNRYFVDRRHMPRAVRQVDRPDMKETPEDVPQAIRTDIKIKNGGNGQ